MVVRSTSVVEVLAISEMKPLFCDGLPVEVTQLGTANHQFAVPAGCVLRSLLIGPAAIVGGVARIFIGQIGL